MSFLDRFGFARKPAYVEFERIAPVISDPGAELDVPTIGVDALGGFGGFGGSFVDSEWTGSKFPGGFGATKLFTMNYWELRKRSAQMFTENMYARGIIRRLITNEINVGLFLEAIPEEAILGYPDDGLAEWSETAENRYALWAKNPKLCDHRELMTFGSLQCAARMESLICGDVLEVIRIDPKTGLPRVQLISGDLIQTPMNKLLDNTVVEGVQLDADKKHLGFYIAQEDGTSVYLPAYGEKTGRLVAKLIYGSQNRHDAVRGEPLLSVILQSLKELDRYKDSAQRKATINSMLAMFIKKTQDKPGTLPISGAAVRKDALPTLGATDSPRQFGMQGLIPGLVIEELQQGEEPVPGSTAGTDVNLGPFETVIVQGMSWCLEIPPEILQLSFSNNYSASQAAINEFKIYLNRIRTAFGENFCQPVYTEWLISETLSGKLQTPGFLAAWRNPAAYDIFAAWTASDWTGAIKPSTDIAKQAKGYKDLVGEGWIDNDRASRELTGTKFVKNIKSVARENLLKVAAAEPIAAFRKKYGPEIADAALRQNETSNAALVSDDIVDAIVDSLEA